MMAALKVIFRIWDFVLRTMDPLKGSIGDPLKQETSGMELRHGKIYGSETGLEKKKNGSRENN